jgi:RND family efflux transporter MFP subunit
MVSESQHEPASPPGGAGRHSVVVAVIVLGVGAVLGVGWQLYARAQAQVNHVALRALPRGVSVVKAKKTTYRAARSYIATIEPWTAATIASQFITGYITSVAVRPGVKVKKGEVLATIDCRHRSAASRAVADHARAIRARQEAMADEARRIAQLFKAGYASVNEAQVKQAEALRQSAEVTVARERAVEIGIEVQDCILRAPFDGEVSERLKDPGGLASPGVPIVRIVDRSIVRIDVDVPESDYPYVEPGTKVRIKVLSTGHMLAGLIARRAPSADPSTRTVRFEVDVPDPDRTIPVGSTARVALEVGDTVAALEIPLRAARIRGEKASVFVVNDGVAHRQLLTMVGESEGSLFASPGLADGALVVTEGRNFLNDGDQVTAKEEKPLADHPPEAPEPKEPKEGQHP